MGDDQARPGKFRRRLAEARHDEVVRQAVKAIAAHARRRDLARQGKLLRESGLGAVEGGIEASNLRQVRRRSGDILDRREIVRLVEWRERHQRGQRGHDIGIDPDRCGEGRAAMHHAMAESLHRPAAQKFPSELQDLRGGRLVVERRLAPLALRHDRPLVIGRAQMRRQADLLDLPVKQRRAFARRVVERELDAGRSSVQDGDAAFARGFWSQFGSLLGLIGG